jgi:hypothetical protein
MTPPVSISTNASVLETIDHTGTPQTTTLVSVRWRLGDSRTVLAQVDRHRSHTTPHHSEAEATSVYELVVRVEHAVTSREPQGHIAFCPGRPQDRSTTERLPVAISVTHATSGAYELRVDGLPRDCGDYRYDGNQGESLPVFLHVAVLSHGETVVLSDIPARLGFAGGTYVLAGAPDVRWSTVTT